MSLMLIQDKGNARVLLINIARLALSKGKTVYSNIDLGLPLILDYPALKPIIKPQSLILLESPSWIDKRCPPTNELNQFYRLITQSRQKIVEIVLTWDSFKYYPYGNDTLSVDEFSKVNIDRRVYFLCKSIGYEDMLYPDGSISFKITNMQTAGVSIIRAIKVEEKA